MHTHQDDRADRAHPGPTRLVAGDRLVVEGAGGEHGGNPLEAVTLAEKWIDNVDLYVGVLAEVRQDAWGADVGKDEVVVVLDGRRALG